MEEQEKLLDEFNDILLNNEDKENELKEIRNEKYNQAEKILIDHSKYEYNFLLKEFSIFIKNIVKDYSNVNDLLLNRCISEKEIVYSDYYTKDAIKYLKTFLETYNLGIIKYNKIIIWNDGITLEILLNSYFEALNSLKSLMTIEEDINKNVETLKRNRGEKNGK